MGRVFAECSNCSANIAVRRRGEYKCMRCGKVWQPTPTEARIAYLVEHAEHGMPPLQVLGVCLLLLAPGVYAGWHDALVSACVGVAGLVLIALARALEPLRRRNIPAEMQRLMALRQPYAVVPPAPMLPPLHIAIAQVKWEKAGHRRSLLAVLWRTVGG
jgi:hypothetical protein